MTQNPKANHKYIHTISVYNTRRGDCILAIPLEKLIQHRCDACVSQDSDITMTRMMVSANQRWILCEFMFPGHDKSFHYGVIDRAKRKFHHVHTNQRSWRVECFLTPQGASELLLCCSVREQGGCLPFPVVFRWDANKPRPSDVDFSRHWNTVAPSFECDPTVVLEHEMRTAANKRIFGYSSRENTFFMWNGSVDQKLSIDPPPHMSNIQECMLMNRSKVLVVIDRVRPNNRHGCRVWTRYLTRDHVRSWQQLKLPQRIQQTLLSDPDSVQFKVVTDSLLVSISTPISPTTTTTTTTTTKDTGLRISTAVWVFRESTTFTGKRKHN